MKQDTEPIPGELREWNLTAGYRGLFLVIGVDGYRVDVVLPNGKKDGFFRTYLEISSHVISKAEGRNYKGR